MTTRSPGEGRRAPCVRRGGDATVIHGPTSTHPRPASASASTGRPDNTAPCQRTLSPRHHGDRANHSVHFCSPDAADSEEMPSNRTTKFAATHTGVDLLPHRRRHETRSPNSSVPPGDRPARRRCAARHCGGRRCCAPPRTMSRNRSALVDVVPCLCERQQEFGRAHPVKRPRAHGPPRVSEPWCRRVEEGAVTVAGPSPRQLP